MKQYLPMKPVKRGFKVWVRADAVTGFFCDFDVYVGRPSDGTATEVELGERVVLQLSECLRGGNYHLYFDNFFTTCRLLDTLHSQGLYACGTVRSNRRSSLTNTARRLAEMNYVIDRMHFKGHIDQWCRENCDPDKLEGMEKVWVSDTYSCSV